MNFRWSSPSYYPRQITLTPTIPYLGANFVLVRCNLSLPPYLPSVSLSHEWREGGGVNFNKTMSEVLSVDYYLPVETGDRWDDSERVMAASNRDARVSRRGRDTLEKYNYSMIIRWCMARSGEMHEAKRVKTSRLLLARTLPALPKFPIYKVSTVARLRVVYLRDLRFRMLI